MPTLNAGQSAVVVVPANMQFRVEAEREAYVDLVGYQSDRLVGVRRFKVYSPTSAEARLSLRGIDGVTTYGGAYIDAPQDLGLLTGARIAAINAALAAGTASYPSGSTVIRTDDGMPLVLRGLGASGQFVAGSSEGVTVQPIRTANFTLVQADSGTVIPVSGNVTVSIDADTNLTDPVEIRRFNAGSLTIASTGVLVLNPATGSAWGTLSVANKLSSIVFYPGSAADEYSALKIGA